MIRKTTNSCPNCGGGLKYYDRVKRILRMKGGYKTFLTVRRFKCVECNKIHRELPEFIFEYKHYEAEIIDGVMAGYITSDTIGYEDYPCERTMSRWLTRKKTYSFMKEMIFMCKFCKKHDLGTGELSNESVKVGEIKDGSLRLELRMLTYSIEGERNSMNHLLLQYDVDSPLAGRCSIAEKVIPIKYCPFCGEEL